MFQRSNRIEMAIHPSITSDDDHDYHDDDDDDDGLLSSVVIHWYADVDTLYRAVTFFFSDS